MLKSGSDVLRHAEAAFDEARLIGQALIGSVALGLTPAGGTAICSEIVSALTERAPDISITFRDLRPAEAEQELRRRELDVVVSRTPPASDVVDSAALGASPAALVVAAGHRLASRETGSRARARRRAAAGVEPPWAFLH